MKLLCLKDVVVRFILSALFISKSLETRCVFQACLTLLSVLVFCIALKTGEACRRLTRKCEALELLSEYTHSQFSPAHHVKS